MEQAIKKQLIGMEGAITISRENLFNKLNIEMTNEEILLDPLFWQALGKGLGWKDGVFNPATPAYGWKIKWHRFIDHLADGKDIDSFFTNLLSN